MFRAHIAKVIAVDLMAKSEKLLLNFFCNNYSIFEVERYDKKPQA